MSNTPSDPDHINTRALERFARAFDYVVKGQARLATAEPHVADLKDMKKSEASPRPVAELQNHRPKFWHWFPPTKALLRFRDDIRLRKYNREWIKNNIH